MNFHTSEPVLFLLPALQAWLTDGSAGKVRHLAIRLVCPDFDTQLLSKPELAFFFF